MLEDFLKHLRTAFSTPGGKLDTGALLSAVTSSAVTARDGTRKIAESSRTERDRESRFAALREGGVRPDLIELVGYLEDQAEQLGLSFGMQRKTTEWTGYEPRLRAPGARRDPRHYRLFTDEGVAVVRPGAARRCRGEGRGLPMMGVLTQPVRKTSTCLTLPSRALT